MYHVWGFEVESAMMGNLYFPKVIYQTKYTSLHKVRAKIVGFGPGTTF